MDGKHHDAGGAYFSATFYASDGAILPLEREMKDKNIFTSKKFAAFFFSVCAITYNLLFARPDTWPAVMFSSIGILGIVMLCLGYVFPQSKFDKALSVLRSQVDNPGPWMSLDPGGK